MPEIKQFCNGNSIVNAYNAEGVKLSSTYYTLPEAIAVPAGEVLEPDTVLNASRTMTVQYLGHMDKTIIGDSVSYVMHHPEGYVLMDSFFGKVAWNYFRRDHLGNNVAVWNATADTTVQRMFYYPSGLPMALSSGQGAQPYKYNGKEYDEMHGYDVYDYGFRGYYASIARFTSIDPLCENTPWQSPYCYASNNFTGEIDWMGLSGGEAYTTSDPATIAALMSYLIGGGKLNDYDLDGNGLWIDITDDVNNSASLFLQSVFWTDVAPSFNPIFLCNVSVTGSSYTIFEKDKHNSKIIEELSRRALLEISRNTGIVESIQVNPFFWMGKEGDIYYRSQRYGPQRYVYNRSYELAIKRLKKSPIGIFGTVLGVISAGIAIDDMIQNGITVGNVVDASVAIIGLCGPWGMLLATSYEIADWGTEYFTGTSISNRLGGIQLLDKTW